VRVSSRIALGALLALLAGCKVSPPDDGGGDTADASTVLTTPQVNAPGSTPLDTVAIGGKATGATRIVVKNADTDESIVNALLPSGEFCVDAPLTAGDTTSFKVIAVAEDGSISNPVAVDVDQDDGAPPPSDPTCDQDQSECADSEDCSTPMVDDDCDGYGDSSDSDCTGCEDDYMEPNDLPFQSPMVSPDTYDGLKICPGPREDWFAFLVPPGGRVTVSIQITSDVDIDLELYKASDAESSPRGPYVAKSDGSTSIESITYTSTGGGAYDLRIFSYREDAQGSYNLTVR